MTEPQMERTPKISVIICSRDRDSSLRNTLDSLFTPKNLEAKDWECLLVYYPPDRATQQVADDYALRFPSRLTPIGQHGTGKSIALNDGIRASRGEILSFTDDDCLCDSGYLDGIREVFSDPTIHAAQGRQAAEFESGGSGRFGREFAGLMGHLEQGDKLQLLPPQNKLGGGNMVLRRQVFAKTGGFRPDLGAGAPGAGGMLEDNELGQRVLKAGYRIFYAPQILIRHQIPAERVTRWFVVHRFYKTGSSQAHFIPLWNPSVPQWRLAVYWGKQALGGGARALRLLLTGRSGEAMDVLMPTVGGLGFYLEHVRLQRRGITDFPVPAVVDQEERPIPRREGVEGASAG